MYNSNQFQRTFLGNPNAVPTVNLGSTAQIFTGSGTFHGVVVGTTTGTAFVVSDSTTQTRVVLQDGSTAMLLKASVAEGVYTNIDAAIANGLYVSFGINGTYTVLWSK